MAPWIPPCQAGWLLVASQNVHFFVSFLVPGPFGVSFVVFFSFFLSYLYFDRFVLMKAFFFRVYCTRLFSFRFFFPRACGSDKRGLCRWLLKVGAGGNGAFERVEYDSCVSVSWESNAWKYSVQRERSRRFESVVRLLARCCATQRWCLAGRRSACCRGKTIEIRKRGGLEWEEAAVRRNIVTQVVCIHAFAGAPCLWF